MIPPGVMVQVEAALFQDLAKALERVVTSQTARRENRSGGPLLTPDEESNLIQDCHQLLAGFLEQLGGIVQQIETDMKLRAMEGCDDPECTYCRAVRAAVN